MSSALEDLLRSYSSNAQQTIAKMNGLDPEALQGTPDHVRVLAQALARPERIERVLSDLDGVERLVLERLLLQNGQAKTDLLRQELLQSGFIPESPSAKYVGSPYRQLPRYFEDVLARLAALGLVLSTGDSERNDLAEPAELSPGARVLIPDEIRRTLPSSPTWLPTLPPDGLSQIVEGAPDEFQRDLFLFWSYANSHQMVLTSRGWIPKRHWTHLNEEFRYKESLRGLRNEGETGRFGFLHILMEEMGLLQQAERELKPAPNSREFLALSLRARTERALRAWLRASAWNELSRIQELSSNSPRPPSSRLTSALKGARQFVAGLLRHAPPDQWVSLKGFIERARAVNDEFLLPRYHSYYGFHNPYHGHGNAVSWEFPAFDEAKGWDLVEARLIANMLQEPLHWLGVVSLGWAANEPVAFRVTPIGAQILGISSPQPEQAPERRIIVQPNFQIFALDPISDYTLSLLDEFAERVKSERVFEYQLSRESVYEAQQKGVTAAQIAAFLDRESNTPVPQNVKMTLHEWGRYHERIVFYQGIALCQVAEPDILDRILNDPRVSAHLAARISPTTAMARGSGAGLQGLRKALHGKGILSTSTRSMPPYAVQPDGRIRFRHRVPDFHILHQLAPFTLERDGDLRITEEAVAKAASTGWTAARIIQTLSAQQQEALPLDVVSKIKVWGKHYGDAAISKVTLVQFKSADILRELAEDLEIGPLIVPFSPTGALAIVRDENVDALRAALRQRGMGLDSQLRSG